MRKQQPHQEIAAPEAASDVAKESSAVAAAEPQSEKNNDVRNRTDKVKNKGFFTTRRITQLAVFVAMALVMKLIGKSLTITPTFTVTFIYLPWLLSGVVLGPIGGMIVGGISDVLGNLIFGSPFIPLTFVSNTLFALPIGLIYKFAPIKDDFAKCALGALCSLVLCTLGIGSLALWHFYKYYESLNFFRYLQLFRMPQVGVFAINAGVLLALIKPLQSVGIFPAPHAAAIKLPRAAVFGVCVTLFTALFVTAIVLLSRKYGADPAPETAAKTLSYAASYIAAGAIYLTLLLQSALLIAGKNKVARIIIGVGTAVALATAVAFIIAAQVALADIGQKSQIQFVYLLSIAAALIALAVAIGVARRIGITRRKQNK